MKRRPRRTTAEQVDSLIHRRQDRERQHRSTKDIDAVLVPLRCRQIRRELREERKR